MDSNDIPSLEEDPSAEELESKETAVTNPFSLGKKALQDKTRQLLEIPEDIKQVKSNLKRETLKRIMMRFRLLSTLLLKFPESESMHEYKQSDSAQSKIKTALNTFDVNMFKRSYKTVDLEPRVKCILMKPREFRTPEEIKLVQKNIENLSFFEKYSKNTHYELAQVLNYQFINTGRIVVKQGHMPIAFYFIISGCLAAEVDEKDMASGRQRTRMIGELRAGEMFGELALIHNTPRTATVQTRYPTEVLFLYKDDFDAILRSNARNIWLSRFNALTKLKYFSQWSPEQIQDCSNNCKTMKFPDNKVIIGNTEYHHPSENLYFIIEGKCKIIEVLRLIHGNSKNPKAKLHMPPLNLTSQELASSLKPESKIVRRYLHIMTLEPGQYFGAGEDLRRRYIVAWGKTELISIPHLFLRRRDHLTWVELLQDNLQALLPSHAAVFQEFVRRAVWRTYKHDLREEILHHIRKTCPTSLDDVPLSVRQAEKMENWNTIQDA